MRDERRRAIRLVGVMSLACAVMILGNASPAQAGYSLNVTIQGFGTVTKSPDKSSYNSGEVVTLTAVPAAGYTFGAWSGAIPGTASPASLTMNGNKSVTAIFGTQTAYVAVNGNDTNPGTVDQPVASLEKALALIDGQPGSGEIIIRGGVYSPDACINVYPPKLAVPYQADRTLTIRGADNESVFFDGSILLDDRVTPLDGEPGIYLVKGAFPKERAPDIWEDAAHIRYWRVANLEALRVKANASVVLDVTTLALRIREGEAPNGKKIRMGKAQKAFHIFRSHVTVKNINFQGYNADPSSTAIMIGYNASVANDGTRTSKDITRNVTIDSCHAHNCYRGFWIWTGAKNTRITNCRVTTAATGIFAQGEDNMTDHCTLLNEEESFLLRDVMAGDASGIRSYGWSKNGVYSYNFVFGFKNGIYVKSVPGDYIVEHNTLIRGLKDKSGQTGLGLRFTLPTRTPELRVRYNLVSGFVYALDREDSYTFPAGAIFDRNIFWNPVYLKLAQDQVSTLNATEAGENNRAEDPYFALPRVQNGDYRLLPSSPAVALGEGGSPAGALGVVPSGYQGPPHLWVALPYISGMLGQDYFPPIGYSRYSCYISGQRSIPVTLHAAAVGPVDKTRIRINGETLPDRDFKENDSFELPDADGFYTIDFSVHNAQGFWSPFETLYITLDRKGPVVIGEPKILANAHGAMFIPQTSRPAMIKLEYWEGTAWKEAANTRNLFQSIMPEDLRPFGYPHPLLVTGLVPNQTYKYRLSLSGPVRGYSIKEGTFRLSGETKVLYVAPQGLDQEGGGGPDSPYRTFQFALDRALPGDTVRLLPGVYFGPTVLFHGGSSEHPLVIEGISPNAVYLDALKEYTNTLTLINAPFVTVRNLNMQWFISAGISCNNSPSVQISQCRFRNNYWLTEEWMEGTGISLEASPHFQIDHSIFSLSWIGAYFRNSAGGRVLHNTFLGTEAVGLVWGKNSSEDTVVQYNSFHFDGNHHIQVAEFRDPFNKGVLDYNNYATRVYNAPPTSMEYQYPLFAEFPYLSSNREFMYYIDNPDTDASKVTVIHTFADWRAFSGKDANSIFANPQFVDPKAGRFDVRAGSPNLRDDLPDGSGFIGAVGYHPELPQPPSVTLTSPAGGRRFSTTASIPFDAEAFADRGGSIAGVGFYINGSPYSEDSSAPYSYRRTLPAGEYKIRALATDNSGLKTATPEIVITVQAGIVYGDVSGDGQILAQDAWLVARYSVGLIPDAQIPGFCNGLTAEEFKRRGDVDGVAGLSANDAMLIAKRAVGLIDRFPVET